MCNIGAKFRCDSYIEIIPSFIYTHHISRSCRIGYLCPGGLDLELNLELVVVPNLGPSREAAKKKSQELNQQLVLYPYLNLNRVIR